ncbi:sigma-70 family RNA polymerase sigma factor [soil metagenome]
MTTDDEFLHQTLPSMDLVYNLARRCTTSRQDAEDLVQETYLRALKSWRSHRRPDKVEPWLATICLNIVRSDYRRRTRRPVELLQADPPVAISSGDRTDDRAIESIERSAVHRALWELPEEQRVAVVLVDICGFTAREASQITRSPRGTMLARVHRGRKALAGTQSMRQVDRNET